MAVEAENAEAKARAQQEEADLKEERLLQEQADARAEYEKEQSDAYTDHQTEVNPYGPSAEKMAEDGFSGSGYSESVKNRSLMDYQNRVAVARQGFDQAVRDYDLAIREARQQNSAALAKIAYDALKRQTDLAMKAAKQQEQLRQQWDKQRQNQEKYYQELEEEVYEEVLENPGQRAAEQTRLPDSPNAEIRWWSI
jgi:hypothetical protein